MLWRRPYEFRRWWRNTRAPRIFAIGLAAGLLAFAAIEYLRDGPGDACEPLGSTMTYWRIIPRGSTGRHSTLVCEVAMDGTLYWARVRREP